MNQVLTAIDMNCMQFLYGQGCLNPIEYSFLPADQGPDGLNTLIFQFTTNKGDGGDGEQW